MRKKVKKNVAEGIAHVHASFNNTIVTITDRQGNALAWATSGNATASRVRANPRRFAAQIAAEQCRQARLSGMRCEESLKCASKDPGPGRESAVRALNAVGFQNHQSISPM